MLLCTPVRLPCKMHARVCWPLTTAIWRTFSVMPTGWPTLVTLRTLSVSNLRIISLTLFTTRLRTIQQNIRDSRNHAVAGAPHIRHLREAFAGVQLLFTHLSQFDSCIAVEVATAGCFVAQTRNGALALTSLGLPAVCLNLLESQVEAVQLASCRLLLGKPG